MCGDIHATHLPHFLCSTTTKNKSEENKIFSDIELAKKKKARLLLLIAMVTKVLISICYML